MFTNEKSANKTKGLSGKKDEKPGSSVCDGEDFRQESRVSDMLSQPWAILLLS